MDEMRNGLRYLAVAGNILFVLWILFNAMDEGPATTPPIQIVLLIGMLMVLSLNAALLSTERYARYVIMAGNVVFGLWFLSTWIGRAQATSPEFGSLIFLTALLALNTFLLYRK